MALKTFNLNQEVYKEFSKHCKEHGISMSKKIENFIKEELQKIKLFAKPQATKTEENSFSKYCH